MKRFKKIIAIITLLSISMMSCNESEGVTVGLLMENYGSGRWALDKKYFEEKIKELNGKIIIKMSDGNEVTQFNQALELIDEGVDIIVIVAVNVNTAAAIVREAHKKNIKVIAYDRLIRNCDLDYFIGFDAEEIGQLQAKYALERKPQGNYVLLEGDKTDINAVYSERGQKSQLAPKIKNGDINILYRVYVTGWSPAVASHEIEKVIKLSDKPIDVILAANDGTASGAINALKKFDLLDDIIITGLDAELSACQRILKGEQSMTVYTPIKQLANTAASLSMDIARNQKLNYTFSNKNNGRIEVPAIILQAVALDKSNIELVVKDGMYTKEELYGISE